MNSHKSVEYGLFTHNSAPSPRASMPPKSSVFKRLKKLVINSAASVAPPSHAATSTPADVRQRRAEALSACGLLKQSIKYGEQYRDREDYHDDDDASTIISAETQKHAYDVPGKMKDLLIFDEDPKSCKYGQNKMIEISSEEYEMISADLPTPPLSPTRPRPASSCSSSTDSHSLAESDSNTLAYHHPHVQIRRIGSVCEDLERIDDEESRRLTEVAFLM